MCRFEGCLVMLVWSTLFCLSREGFQMLVLFRLEAQVVAEPIPEPSTLVLLSIGVLGLLSLRPRGRSRSYLS